MLKKGLIPAFARSFCLVSAAAIITACSGGSNSSSALPPSQTDTTASAPVAGNAPQNSANAPQTLGSPTPAGAASFNTASSATFGIVQTAHAGSTYASTLNVKLSHAPAAGNVLVLFFEENKSAAFPYSGEVTWPAAATGSAWSYDGSTSSTAILHHVVQAGESGSYTVNVGGSGSGYADYMVAEVAGASTTSPVNNRASNTVAAGTTQFTLGAGITPTTAGTFPVAFFSAHAAGMTWSSVSSGWTIADRNADYTEMVASGPVQTGTAKVNATATISKASGYPGSADVVLLNPASAATGSTPTPAPSSGPTAAPTQTPGAVSATAYKYHGCQVYPANDWFTTNLVTGGSSYASNAVDPNSSAIISNLASSFSGGNFNGDSSTYRDETANVATSTTPMHTVNGTTVVNDPYNDDSKNVVPFQSGFFQEGTAGCAGDCHVVVVNTQNCVDYETYDFGVTSWNGSTLTASGGYVHNLNQPFNNQYSIDKYLISAAGLPIMGTTDFGEDASLSSINHIIGLITPYNNTANQGYVYPATSKKTCSRNCANSLPLGARIRLKSSYVCPSASSYPQANHVCNQLKTYGAIAMDFEGTTGGSVNYTLRFGTTSTGSTPWNTSDLNQLLNNLHITNFDVMKLGTIH